MAHRWFVLLLLPGPAGCAAGGLVPSVVVSMRSTRSSDGGDRSIDRAVEVGLLSATRRPAITHVEAPSASVARASASMRDTACDHPWVCAWERVRVVETLSTFAEARR